MDSICKCNNCEGVFIDTNAQIIAKRFEFGPIFMTELEGHACPNCKTDGYLADMENLEQAKYLWNKLSEIGVNNEDEITSNFLHFETGTNKFDIWHWFEEEFDCDVYDDLLK